MHSVLYAFSTASIYLGFFVLSAVFCLHTRICIQLDCSLADMLLSRPAFKRVSQCRPQIHHPAGALRIHSQCVYTPYDPFIIDFAFQLLQSFALLFFSFSNRELSYSYIIVLLEHVHLCLLFVHKLMALSIV